jgi:predicted adenylyl cyclase CyaB
MAENIEIKARVDNWDAMLARVESLSDGPAAILDQEDVFFAAPSGRLKLRVLAADRGELILYHRSDTAGPKKSTYEIARTGQPDALRSILTAVLPPLGVVRKRRLLYLVGQTRVHLDRVVNLGDFIELEVVLRSGQAAAEGVVIADDLMRSLRIDAAQLVARAYIDLLEKS